VQVRLEKSALFHPNQAVTCLSLLHVRSLPEGPTGQNRLHALNTMVDLTGTEQVRPLQQLHLYSHATWSMSRYGHGKREQLVFALYDLVSVTNGICGILIATADT